MLYLYFHTDLTKQYIYKAKTNQPVICRETLLYLLGKEIKIKPRENMIRSVMDFITGKVKEYITYEIVDIDEITVVEPYALRWLEASCKILIREVKSDEKRI